MTGQVAGVSSATMAAPMPVADAAAGFADDMSLTYRPVQSTVKKDSDEGFWRENSFPCVTAQSNRHSD